MIVILKMYSFNKIKKYYITNNTNVKNSIIDILNKDISSNTFHERNNIKINQCRKTKIICSICNKLYNVYYDRETYIIQSEIEPYYGNELPHYDIDQNNIFVNIVKNNLKADNVTGVPNKNKLIITNSNVISEFVFSFIDNSHIMISIHNRQLSLFDLVKLLYAKYSTKTYFDTKEKTLTCDSNDTQDISLICNDNYYLKFKFYKDSGILVNEFESDVPSIFEFNKINVSFDIDDNNLNILKQYITKVKF